MKKYFLPMFLFLQIFSCAVQSENWSLKSPEKGWNTHELVSLYFHNSELQTQWAWEALSCYSFRGNERVLDFGAGDGKLSALMSFMVPNGSILGVDISKSMSNFAKKMYPTHYYSNLQFNAVSHIDFADFQSDGPFDIVTSFCVFHLVPNPKIVLRNIKSHLHAESKLIATFPIGRSPEFFQAASEEMAKRGWNFPSTTDDSKAMWDPDQVGAIFEDAGFAIEQLRVIETHNPFSTRNEMVDWCVGTLTANWDIPIERSREFFTNVVDRYLTYKPQNLDEDGFVYYTCYRIDLMAKPVFKTPRIA